MKKLSFLEVRARKYGESAGRAIAHSSDRLRQARAEAVEVVQGAVRARPPTTESADSDTSEELKLSSAIEKLKGRDKVGKIAEYGAGVGGAAVGLAAAGTVASVAGASTLLGSTTLAGLLGGVFAVATPVGWVLGSAAVVGTAAFGLTKLARSGAKQDVARTELIQRLSDRLENLKSMSKDAVSDVQELQQLLAVCLAANLITSDQAERILAHVESVSMPTGVAIQRLRDMALEAGVIAASK